MATKKYYFLSGKVKELVRHIYKKISNLIEPKSLKTLFNASVFNASSYYYSSLCVGSFYVALNHPFHAQIFFPISNKYRSLFVSGLSKSSSSVSIGSGSAKGSSVGFGSVQSQGTPGAGPRQPPSSPFDWPDDVDMFAPPVPKPQRQETLPFSVSPSMSKVS